MEKSLKIELTQFSYKIGIIVGVSLIGYIFYSIQDIILSLLLAFAFVLLTSPILDLIESKKISSIFSVAGFLIFTCLVAGLAIVLTIPIIFREVKMAEEFVRNALTIIQSNPEQVEAYLTALSIRYLEPIWVQIQIQDIVWMLQDQAKTILQQVLGFMKTSASVIFLGIGNFVSGATFVWMTLLFYFFAAIDRKKLTRSFMVFLPKKHQSKLIRSRKEMDRVLILWWKGQLIDAFCMAIITGISLWILQFFWLPITNMLSLSIIVGLSVFIPVFWPLIAMIPAVIMALHGWILAALIVVIVYIVIQQIEGYVLIPRIHGQTLDFNSFELIVYMLIAGTLFGVIGILFTLPVIASVRILIKNLI
jgi:predicted PurR-regulated permease PerM